MNKSCTYKSLSIFFILIGAQVLFWFLFFKSAESLINSFSLSHKNINFSTEKIERLQFDIDEELSDLYLSKSIYNPFLTFYLSTSNFNSSSNTGFNSFITEQDLSSDFFARTMKEFHLNNLCYVINSSLIPTDSQIYSTLKHSNNLSSSIFYISCPIFVKETLIGYLSGLVHNHEDNIIIEQNFLQNISLTIGRKISDLL